MTATFAPAVAREVAAALTRARKPWPTPRLYDIRLPAGIVPGFSIDFQGDHLQRLRSSDWLSQGFDGVRFIGAGRGLTHLVAGGGYHDSTLFVGPHNGVVQLESLTVHPAQRKAVHMGLSNAPHHPKFALWARDIALVAEAPTSPDAARAVWGFFGYQCDWNFEDCVFDGVQLNEHDGYGHNWASRGKRFIRCRWEGSGAEGDKSTQRAWEGAYTPNAQLYYADCSFKSWYQPHSWRGGTAICNQGAGADLVVERSVFWGGRDSSHSRCLMVDDGGANTVDHYGLDGTPGGYPPNGWVIVRECGFTGQGTLGSSSPFLRVGNLSTINKPTAKGLFMENCGAYGQHLQFPIPKVPAGRCLVRGCNSPQISEVAHATGMDTRYEAQITLQDRLAPLSEGLYR